MQAGGHVGQLELDGLERADVLPELAPHGGMLQCGIQAEGRASHAAGADVDAPAAHCTAPPPAQASGPCRQGAGLIGVHPSLAL